MDAFKEDKDESLRSNTTVLPENTFRGGLTGRIFPFLAILIDIKLGWNFSVSYFDSQSLILSLENLET